MILVMASHAASSSMDFICNMMIDATDRHSRYVSSRNLLGIKTSSGFIVPVCPRMRTQHSCWFSLLTGRADNASTNGFYRSGGHNTDAGQQSVSERNVICFPVFQACAGDRLVARVYT